MSKMFLMTKKIIECSLNGETGEPEKVYQNCGHARRIAGFGIAGCQGDCAQTIALYGRDRNHHLWQRLEVAR